VRQEKDARSKAKEKKRAILQKAICPGETKKIKVAWEHPSREGHQRPTPEKVAKGAQGATGGVWGIPETFEKRGVAPACSALDVRTPSATKDKKPEKFWKAQPIPQRDLPTVAWEKARIRARSRTRNPYRSFPTNNGGVMFDVLSASAPRKSGIILSHFRSVACTQRPLSDRKTNTQYRTPHAVALPKKIAQKRGGDD